MPAPFAPVEERRDFLLSVRPQFAEKIVTGDKTVELRRRFASNVERDSIVLIYCSSPIQALIGCAMISAVHRLPINALWKKYGPQACIDRTDFSAYFSGADAGYAIVLWNAVRFTNSLNAEYLRDNFDFTAPQSFAYLSDDYYSLIDDDWLQISDRYQRIHRARRPKAN